MKLRNKKTGEIGNLKPYGEDGRIWVWIDNISDPAYRYSSLAELNEEWEDCEEPKKFYIVERRGIVDSRFRTGDGYEEMFKEIGNYFETREEAEKAVEKLKALKRLKDAGFRFECSTLRSDWAGLPEAEALENLIDITAYLPKDKIKERKADLELLFGGEE